MTRYGDLYKESEIQHCHYNFEYADTQRLFLLFDEYEQECLLCLKQKLTAPAYDYCLKCSHTFNLLDARSAISVSERATYILRVRKLAQACAACALGAACE